VHAPQLFSNGHIFAPLLKPSCGPTLPALHSVIYLICSLHSFRFLDIRKLLLYKSNHAKKVSAKNGTRYLHSSIYTRFPSPISESCVHYVHILVLRSLLPLSLCPPPRSSQSERRCNAEVEQRGPHTLALVTTRDVRKGEVRCVSRVLGIGLGLTLDSHTIGSLLLVHKHKPNCRTEGGWKLAHERKHHFLSYLFISFFFVCASSFSSLTAHFLSLWPPTALPIMHSTRKFCGNIHRHGTLLAPSYRGSKKQEFPC